VYLWLSAKTDGLYTVIFSDISSENKISTEPEKLR